MKLLVIFGLCLVATTLATPLSPHLRLRRQATTTANPTCPTESGLGGVLQQVGNLVANLLDNIGRIRVSTLLSGDNSLLKVLSGLLTDVQKLVNDLLGPNLTDSETSQIQGQLGTLLNDIVGVVNNLLGSNEASSWPCTNSVGLLGQLLTSLFGALGNLTGITSNDGGILTDVLKLVLRLLGSVLTSLL